MSKFLVIGLFSAFLACSAFAEDKVERGEFVKVYKAEEYTVSILRYGPEKSNQFLIKVSGIDNAQNNKIYLHEKKCDDTKCSAYKYVTTQVHLPDGKQWFTIINGGAWSGEQLQPYLVANKKVPMNSTPTLLKEIDVQDFVDAYSKQQK